MGIAGSLTGDLRLCDVCYYEDIVDITDNAKVEDIESGMDIALSPSYYETPAQFIFVGKAGVYKGGEPWLLKSIQGNRPMPVGMTTVSRGRQGAPTFQDWWRWRGRSLR